MGGEWLIRRHASEGRLRSVRPLHYVDLGNIGLPDIQRPFVWSNEWTLGSFTFFSAAAALSSLASEHCAPTHEDDREQDSEGEEGKPDQQSGMGVAKISAISLIRAYSRPTC